MIWACYSRVWASMTLRVLKWGFWISFTYFRRVLVVAKVISLRDLTYACYKRLKRSLDFYCFMVVDFVTLLMKVGFGFLSPCVREFESTRQWNMLGLLVWVSFSCIYKMTRSDSLNKFTFNYNLKISGLRHLLILSVLIYFNIC